MSSMAFQMYQIAVEMCQVGFSFDLVFLALVRFKYISKKHALKGTSVSGRGKLLVLGIPPPTQARFCSVHPYERAESVYLRSPAS